MSLYFPVPKWLKTKSMHRHRDKLEHSLWVSCHLQKEYTLTLKGNIIGMPGGSVGRSQTLGSQLRSCSQGLEFKPCIGLHAGQEKEKKRGNIIKKTHVRENGDFEMGRESEKGKKKSLGGFSVENQES